MSNVVVAAVQMTSGADVDANLKQAGRFVAEAAAKGARYIVLPENFAVFDSKALWREGVRERDTGVFTQALVTWAARHDVWIVGGTIPVAGPAMIEADAGRVRARCHLVSPDGLVASYDKLHLFDVDVGDAHGSYRESDSIEPGESAMIIDTPDVVFGMTICYDLRFPGLFSVLREHGASIITVPSAFTRVTGEAHWLTLLRARAIETQCFVIGANQCGQHSPGRETYGHSVIYSPWGETLALGGDQPGLVMATLDMQHLEDVRLRMPISLHSRFSVTGPKPRT